MTRTISLIAAALALLAPAAASAAPGDLDSSWGTNGVAEIDTMPGLGPVLVQEDDSVAGGTLVYDSFNFLHLLSTRVAPDDGSLDSSWGGGLVDTPLPSDRDDARLMTARRHAGGNLFFGASHLGGVSQGDRWDVMLLRYDDEGNPDPDFGESGQVHDALPSSLEPSTLLLGGGVTIQPPDDKIVVGATITPSPGVSSGVLVRYNADGTPDSSFGPDGVLDLGPSDIIAVHDVVSDASGALFFSLQKSDGNLYLARWTEEFGVQLTEPTPTPAFRVLLQSDGKIVILSGIDSQGVGGVQMSRYDIEGQLDSSFGVSGSYVHEPESPNIYWSSATLDAADRIVVAGSSTQGFYDGLLSVARYTPNGFPDTDFAGPNGVAVHVSADPSAVPALDVGIQSGDRIVTGGFDLNNRSAFVRLIGGDFQPPPPEPPVNITPPFLTPPIALEGDTLTCNEGTWTGPALGFITFWLRDGTVLNHFLRDYQTTADDVDRVILCAVSAVYGDGQLTDPAFTANAVSPGRRTPPDPELPETLIVSGPAEGSTTSDDTPTFVFGGDRAAIFQCRVDAEPFATCQSPHTTRALRPGRHTFQVRAVDTFGRPDGTPAARSFTLAAPETDLTDLIPEVAESFVAKEIKEGVLIAVPTSARAAGFGSAKAAQKGMKFVPLSRVREIPIGSFLDTRKGEVQLTMATAAGARPSTESARAFSGLFQVLQGRGTKPVTELQLKGTAPRPCRSRSARTAQRGRVRRLWADGRGRFRTRGRYAAATVRGTRWLTEDRCDGTLTRVTRGTVVVRDLRRKRNITVRAGKSYFARAR